MTDRSQTASAVRAGWHFSLGELPRILVGTAGVVAVAVYVDRLHADSNWPDVYVSGTNFTASTLFSALVGYFVCRRFFGRFTGLLAGMASAGMVGSVVLWRKGDDMRDFAILGILVACSLFVAFGWVDRGQKRDNTPHPSSDQPPAGPHSGPRVE